MPKTPPHFDVGALLEQVHEQDLGLWVSTNNPGGFRRTLYTHMRKHAQLRVHVYADPRSPNRFCLLKQALAPNGAANA